MFAFNAFQAVQYEVGDVLEVLPSQDSAAVDAFIQRCNLDPEAFITVSSTFDLTLIFILESLSCLKMVFIYVH